MNGNTGQARTVHPRGRGARARAVCAGGAAAAVLLLGGCGDGDQGGGPAGPSSSRPGTPASPSTPAAASASASAPAGTPSPTGSPAVDRARAEQAALTSAPGSTVVSSHLETEDGRPVWEVELADAQGRKDDVDVDATTGRVQPDDGTDHDHDQDDD